MNIRSVVFDLDGTLVDSAHVCAGIFNSMLAERGSEVQLTGQAIQGTLSIGGTHMVRTVMGAHTLQPEADLALFRERYASLPTPSDCLYPGAREVLHALQQQDVLIGLCTKKPERLAHKVLEELGIDRYFQHVSCGDSTRYPKPDKRHLLEVLAGLDVRPDQALMVGDSIVDQDLARNAGVRFVFARYGYDEQEVLQHLCHASLGGLAELMPLIPGVPSRAVRAAVAAGRPAAAPRAVA